MLEKREEFPEEKDEKPNKIPNPRGDFGHYHHKKLQRMQGWADYFVEQADKFQNAVPPDYNQWIASLVGAGYFGDTLSKVKLRTELDKLKEKRRENVTYTPKQQLQVAHFQLTGIGRKQNEEEAVTSYGKLVEEYGSPQAQFSLAMCYMDGIVVKQNVALGMEYLQKSMNQGYALARYQYTLGFFLGKGGYVDLDLCFQNFLEMANEGCAFACTIVGVFYQYGICVKQDPRMAEGYIKHGEQAGFSIDRLGKELSLALEDLICDSFDSDDMEFFNEEYPFPSSEE